MYKEKQYKSADYNSVSPYFIVHDAQKFIDHIKKIFNAQELRRYNREDGSIMHAELKISDSVIMLASANKKFKPIAFWVHVYVPSAQETLQKALSLGCESIEPPTHKKDDPDIKGTFKDCAGNMWSIGTQVA